jgi:3-dehydroquinate synthetase
MTRRVRVDLGERGYDVVIDDSFAELGRFVRGRRRVAMVTQEAVDRHVGGLVRAELSGAGVAYETFTMADGEDGKTLTTVEELSRGFARWGLLRPDLVVAVGGGVVGDTAGFAASAYYRGVDVVHVPTTLLAMVDSAIGGKTGVNLPEGKNLVGTFYQPRLVISDVETLTWLPSLMATCSAGHASSSPLLTATKASALSSNRDC